jgi:hypothetical protein
MGQRLWFYHFVHFLGDGVLDSMDQGPCLLQATVLHPPGRQKSNGKVCVWNW